MPRPFRFGVNLLTPAPADEWRAKCRRAEELGYDVLLVPDHLGMVAPFPPHWSPRRRRPSGHGWARSCSTRASGTRLCSPER